MKFQFLFLNSNLDFSKVLGVVGLVSGLFGLFNDKFTF